MSERVVVYRTPFGVNRQDLLSEDRGCYVRMGVSFGSAEDAARWINNQQNPIDYHYTWENTMTKALVVLSGGQDSVTCLGWALNNYDEVACVTFNYGQRHALEIEAAIASIYHFQSHTGRTIPHEVVQLPEGILAGSSFLTDKTRDVERFENFDQMSMHNSYKENKLDSSFVPMRNALFLTLAANRAYTQECDAIVTGITAADYAEFGEFSWEWLGGFVDAEGHFSTVNGDSYRLSVSQKDPDLLHRLQGWLQQQLPGTSTSVGVNDNGEANLYIGSRALEQMLPLLSLHLHSEHRRRQAEARGVTLLPEASLCDAYVAGFWEGDGSCYSSVAPGRTGKKYVASFQFHMYQKDPQVLGAIQEYLGVGYLYQRNTQNKIWVLSVSDGPMGRKLLDRFLPHLNVLGSFEKIAKWRHRINMDFGCFNPPYPDCTPDFLYRINRSNEEAVKQPGRKAAIVIAPLMFISKAESIRLARKLPHTYAALAYSHTAYDGSYPPVGTDHASVLRAHGFEQAGVPDPLVLRANKEGLCPLPDTPNYAVPALAVAETEMAL